MATPPYGANAVRFVGQSSNPISNSTFGVYFTTAGKPQCSMNGNIAILMFGVVAANTSSLTSGLAGSYPGTVLAIVQSTNQIFVSYDSVNWTALS